MGRRQRTHRRVVADALRALPTLYGGRGPSEAERRLVLLERELRVDGEVAEMTDPADRLAEIEARNQRWDIEIAAKHKADVEWLCERARSLEADKSRLERELGESEANREAAVQAQGPMLAEVDRLKAQDELHWKTRRALIKERDAARATAEWERKLARDARIEREEARAEAEALRAALKDAKDDSAIYCKRWRKADEEAKDWAGAAQWAEDYIETLDDGVVANYRSYIEARAREASGGNYCTCKMGCWGIQQWNPACLVHKAALARPSQARCEKCGLTPGEHYSKHHSFQGTPLAGDGKGGVRDTAEPARPSSEAPAKPASGSPAAEPPELPECPHGYGGGAIRLCPDCGECPGHWIDLQEPIIPVSGRGYHTAIRVRCHDAAACPSRKGVP